MHDEINMGVAVDINFDGLLAPVVKGVEGKRLRQIAREIKDVADRTAPNSFGLTTFPAARSH